MVPSSALLETAQEWKREAGQLEDENKYLKDEVKGLKIENKDLNLKGEIKRLRTK